MRTTGTLAALALALVAASACRADTASEISVDLKLDEIDYVTGERVRGVVDVQNMAPQEVSVGYPDSRDRFLIEVYRSSDMLELERISRHPFVAAFSVRANEGQKLEVFLADHFGLREPSRYLARPVLVHAGKRYEGQYRVFDIVPGMKSTSALQMFANRKGLSREFELVHWARKGREHLFLTAKDSGENGRRWQATDIGPMMKITKPTISIMPGGEVIVLHRTSPDQFIRSEFWSLPDALELRSRMSVQDPDTAGQNRVQEMYKESGGVKAVARPWWKFW